MASVEPPLDRRVVAALSRHPLVRSVRLVGSRAEGRAKEWSDWDFAVDVDDFDAVAQDLPALCAPLQPVAQQWDPLSPEYCWMLMLPGPTKVDLVFLDRPHPLERPWQPARDSLVDIDRHFWDWALWLRSKERSGKTDLVTAELEKLTQHLLAPLGVEATPASVAEAVAVYRGARARAERRFACEVPRELEAAVAGSVLGEV